MPGVEGDGPRPGGGAPCLDMWKALRRAAMSGFIAPPRPMVLTVGAGLRAALTLPNGVEDGVMLSEVGAADVDTERGDIWGGWRSDGDSGRDDAVDEGEGSGLLESSDGADAMIAIVTDCPRGMGQYSAVQCCAVLCFVIQGSICLLPSDEMNANGCERMCWMACRSVSSG